MVTLLTSKERPLIRRIPLKADSTGVAREFLEEEEVLDDDTGDLSEAVDDTGDSPDGLVRQLKASGVAPELVEQVRKGAMLQSRFTQLRQQDTTRLRELEIQNAALAGLVQMGRPSANTEQQKSKVDLLLEEEGASGDPTLKKFLGRFASAVREDAEQSIGGRVMRELEPDRRMLQGIKTQEARNQSLRGLQKVYGEGVNKYFDAVWDTVLEAARRGSAISPDYVLHNVYPDIARKLAMETTEKRQKMKAKTVGSRTMEGHVRTGRRQPPGQSSKDDGKAPPSIDELVDRWEAERVAAGLSTELFPRSR